ncbi:MAG: SusC/RagA family TonB-linked outer membrane protein [Bacteroidota bacterium]
MQNNYQIASERKLIPPEPSKFILTCLAICVFVSFYAPAVSKPSPISENNFQGVTITGKVTDDGDMPLPGVSVLEKGTTNGTATDADGNYKLTVSSRDAVVVFTFVGTRTQQIAVAEQSEINVQLITDVSTLDEVVVVGYGTQEKKDITGAVTSLKTEDFNRGIIASPEQLLQGKVAGVNVTSASGEPGGPLSITVRGPGGVRSNNTPLFVVDGLPLDNSTTGGSTNPLNFLNPQDIDVLKDASATAIYGARGANGVIIVTTKRGKAGKSSMSYSAGFGFSKLARKIDVLSADEYRQKVVEVGGVLEDSLANTDWQDVITRTAPTQTHNLTLGGGAEKLSYFASLGLQDQDGIIINSNMKRYSGRININQKLIDDKLNIEVNLSASQTINKRPPSEGNNGTSISILGTALVTNPTYPVYGSDGTPSKYPSGTNPLRTLELNKDVTTINRLIGNITPSFEIIKGLVYKLNFGIDNSNATRDIVSYPSLVPLQDGRLEVINWYNNNNLIENYLTYSFTKGDHVTTILAGHSYQKFTQQRRSFSINKFPVNDLDPSYVPGTGTDLTLANNRPTGEAGKDELQSFFARATYQFKDRYLLTATVRADGSTKFGENKKYGTFPSFSFGWRISEEPFMQSIPVSNLKLRVGWGQTGNQEIIRKQTQALFLTSQGAGNTYPLDGSTYPAGTVYQRLANPDLQWEVSTQTNIGLDFGLLSGALSGSVDYFRKVSSKILLEVPASDPVQPVSVYIANIPDMKINNSGVEIALNYQFTGGNGLTFNIGGNTTFINNDIEKSPYTVIPSGSATGSGLTSQTINGYINGEPIGTFFLKDFIGFDESGMSAYRDTDADGIITDKDRIAAGSALPTKMYNFYGNVAFKGFDLTVNFNGVSGNKVYDNTANANFYKLRISKGLNVTDEGLSPQESIANAAPVSTRYLKNGAFLRLNNLALGYNFSPKSIGLDQWINGLRLSVTGQNLFVITDYDGYDPEVNADKGINSVGNYAISSYGIDYQSYPKARSVIFGLNVSF